MGGGGRGEEEKKELKWTSPPFIKLLKIVKCSGLYWKYIIMHYLFSF